MKNSTKVKNGPPRGILWRIHGKPCKTKQKRRMRVHDPETVRCKVTLYQKVYKTLRNQPFGIKVNHPNEDLGN